MSSEKGVFLYCHVWGVWIVFYYRFFLWTIYSILYSQECYLLFPSFNIVISEEVDNALWRVIYVFIYELFPYHSDILSYISHIILKLQGIFLPFFKLHYSVEIWYISFICNQSKYSEYHFWILIYLVNVCLNVYFLIIVQISLLICHNIHCLTFVW